MLGKLIGVDLHERLLVPVWLHDQLVGACTAHHVRKDDMSISSVETFLSSSPSKEPAVVYSASFC
jgi:hypothetical protein